MTRGAPCGVSAGGGGAGSRDSEMSSKADGLTSACFLRPDQNTGNKRPNSSSITSQASRIRSYHSCNEEESPGGTPSGAARDLRQPWRQETRRTRPPGSRRCPARAGGRLSSTRAKRRRRGRRGRPRLRRRRRHLRPGTRTRTNGRGMGGAQSNRS